MSDIELVIKIPKELYEAYKCRPPMLGDAGMDMIAQSIASGIPLEKLIGTEILKAKQNITVGKEDYNMGIYVGLIKALNLFEDKESDDVLKVLEQQPCEDCISREAVDNYIVKLMSGYLYDEERARLEDLTAYIWELPSVTPSYNSVKTELEPCEDCISRQAAIDALQGRK